jgi:bloom syndrome protein
MNSSTLNNLADHLTWLLREKPFIPPPCDAQLPTPIPPNSRTTSAANSATETANTQNNEPEFTRHPGSRVGFQLSQPQSQTAGQAQVRRQESSIQPTPPSSGPLEMARLRSAPSSASRPGLVSQKSVRQTGNHGKSRLPVYWPSRSNTKTKLTSDAST